jgi:hypothetical protein
MGQPNLALWPGFRSVLTHSWSEACGRRELAVGLQSTSPHPAARDHPVGAGLLQPLPPSDPVQ